MALMELLLLKKVRIFGTTFSSIGVRPGRHRLPLQASYE